MSLELKKAHSEFEVKIIMQMMLIVTIKTLPKFVQRKEGLFCL